MATSSMVVKETRSLSFEAKFLLEEPGRPKTLFVDERVEEVLGFSAADFLYGQLSLLDRIHADDRDYAATLFSSPEKRLKSGESPGSGRFPEPGRRAGSLSLRVRHADGKIRCMRATFRRRPRGGLEILDLRLEDAKSLWRPLDEGHSRSALFRALMENSGDIIFFKDRNHVFTAASRSLQAALNMRLGGMDPVGLTDYDFLPEAEADAFYRPAKEVLAGAEVSRALERVALPNGKVRWVDERKYPVRGDEGEVIGLFAVVRDVSERVEAESMLSQREAVLEESQRIAGVGNYVFDILAQQWTSSEVLDSLFGVKPRIKHPVGEWTALLHPEDRDAVTAYLAECVSTGERFDKVYRIVRATDGAVRWMHGVGKFELGEDGRPETMLGAIRDITDQKLIEASLRTSKELLQLFIEHAPAALAMYDREMRVLAVSKRALEVYGVSEESLLGRSAYELMPNMPERWKQEHRRGLAGETVRIDEDRFERADGSVRWLRRELLPWRLSNGEVGGIVTLTEDVTNAKEADDRLKLAAKVFTNASEAIVITGLDGAILEVNEAFTRVTGYARNEVVGKNPRILQSGMHGREFYEELWRSIAETGHWRGEFLNRRKNGEIFASLSIISTVFDAAGKPKHYVALFSDITPIKEQERKLAQVAHYDALTGLPNRTLLTERLRQAMSDPAAQQMLAVACFDLDLFKSVNDRHGRETGDALLTSVASRMKQALREGDTLARVGGDEFAAVLVDLEDADAAVPVLAALQRAAGEPIRIGELELQVSASAGVVFYPQAEDVDADQLLRQASQALYQAKVAGKDRCHVFDATQDRTVRSHHEDIEHVRQALMGHELVLHYQPKVNMATGTMVGAEALLRWQHPQWGMLAPGMFLPIIEHHPLAVEVGEWVIDTALAQMERWRAQGLRVPVSVNVFAQQLQAPEFIDRLRVLLDAHPGVEPSSLELEVLETSALMEIGQVSQRIAECRELGVSVALDDFGTGYSSLTYLKRLPANVLKIDQSFVRDMLSDPDDLAILEGILGLATAFRRQAVAEGVETVEHGAMLLQLGCELAQGYGIARPMPADDLPGWAAAWKPDSRWRNACAVSPADWPVLYAGVEHRAWMKLLESYLRDERQSAPVLGETQCRMGAWLQAERAGPRGALPAFGEVEILHRRLHKAASEAVALKAQGRTGQSLKRFAEIGPALEAGLALSQEVIRQETIRKS